MLQRAMVPQQWRFRSATVDVHLTEADRLAKLGLPPDGLPMLEGCHQLKDYVLIGVLPDRNSLDSIYWWCDDEIQKLKILAALQDRYRHEPLLMFHLRESSDPEILLRKWTEAGLKVRLSVNLGFDWSRRALQEYLPHENCSIRRLELFGGNGEQLSELAGPIGLNKSVTRLSLSGVSNGEYQSPVGFLNQLASSEVVELKLEHCLTSKMGPENERERTQDDASYSARTVQYACQESHHRTLNTATSVAVSARSLSAFVTSTGIRQNRTLLKIEFHATPSYPSKDLMLTSQGREFQLFTQRHLSRIEEPESEELGPPGTE